MLMEELKFVIRDVKDYPKPGIIFRDITPLLMNPKLFGRVVDAMAEMYRDRNIDAIAAIEARGFIFGAVLAHALGCAFIPVRKAGKLPFHTRKQHYDLEYGTAEIEVHTDAFQHGDRVIIHDDVLATGGTACAAGELVRTAGAEIVAFSFLINLGFLKGEEKVKNQFNISPDYLVHY